MTKDAKRIPGFNRYSIDKNGDVFDHKKGKYILRFMTSPGYWGVNIVNDAGVRKQQHVHSLLLNTFISPRKVGQVCRHIDGNPLNNELSNLAWGTQRENIHDQIRHGTFVDGEKNGRSKLKLPQVVEIYERHKSGQYIRALAREYGVSQCVIQRIVRKTGWTRALRGVA